jgi:hypothetical protein
MQAELGKVVGGLHGWAPAEPQPAGPRGASDHGRFAALLRRLEGLLAENDVACNDVLDELAALDIPVVRAVLDALRAKAENYDFDGALADLGALKEAAARAAGQEGR